MLHYLKGYFTYCNYPFKRLRLTKAMEYMPKYVTKVTVTEK